MRYFARPSDMHLLSIVIATRYSSAYIEKTLLEVVEVLRAADVDFELVVVNDGGDSDTKEVVLQFKNQFQHITYVGLKDSFGQQAAIHAGMEHAAGQYIVTFDDDLQYKASEIIRLTNHILSHPQLNIVCGHSESKQHKGWYSKLSVYITRVLEQLFFRAYKNVHYFTSLKIFDRSILKNVRPGNPVNIYFFWDFDPARIGYIHVAHFSRTMGMSGYHFLSYLKFFRHIMVKILLRMNLFALMAWLPIAYFLLSPIFLFAGMLVSFLIWLSGTIFLSKIKAKRAEIEELIQ
jgi:glycosyltransferase involved in cell wall biosynthesis